MLRFPRYGWWPATLVIMILLAVASRPGNPSHSSRSIDDWSVIEMAEHLNCMGLKLHMHPTQAKGAIGQTVFLTTIATDWSDLNKLNKDGKRIHEWRGVLFCERLVDNGSMRATHLMGDRCLLVGPFLFYGDAELLDRVRATLASVAP